MRRLTACLILLIALCSRALGSLVVYFPTSSQMVIWQDQLYCFVAPGYPTVLDMQTGEVVWQDRVSQSVVGPNTIFIIDNRAYRLTAKGACHDFKTGEPMWQLADSADFFSPQLLLRVNDRLVLALWPQSATPGRDDPSADVRLVDPRTGETVVARDFDPQVVMRSLDSSPPAWATQVPSYSFYRRPIASYRADDVVPHFATDCYVLVWVAAVAPGMPPQEHAPYIMKHGDRQWLGLSRMQHVRSWIDNAVQQGNRLVTYSGTGRIECVELDTGQTRWLHQSLIQNPAPFQRVDDFPTDTQWDRYRYRPRWQRDYELGGTIAAPLPDPTTWLAVYAQLAREPRPSTAFSQTGQWHIDYGRFPRNPVSQGRLAIIVVSTAVLLLAALIVAGWTLWRPWRRRENALDRAVARAWGYAAVLLAMLVCSDLASWSGPLLVGLAYAMGAIVLWDIFRARATTDALRFRRVTANVILATVAFGVLRYLDLF